MAECVLTKAGGGADLDAVTATAADIVAPKVIVGQDGEPITGTMVDRGNWNSTELAAGESVTIPAGKHGGGGKVTTKSLAAQTGGATATDQYVKSGLTYWKDGVKRTGTMVVSSVVSFSVAAYSTSQVLATWKNPAKGPYSGVAICAKNGGYPANINDGRVYTGIGSNSTLSGASSQIIGGLTAGTTYYFRIWVYCTASSGDMYSGYLQATCAPTAHGRQVFTSSGIFTVPVGVQSINIHCTGGGSAGMCDSWNKSSSDNGTTWSRGGGGGGGGYTAYRNGIAVSSGQQIVCEVGAGGPESNYNTDGNRVINKAGGVSSAALNGTLLVKADGGKIVGISSTTSSQTPAPGGSGGGRGSYADYYGGTQNIENAGSGGSGGSDGKYSPTSSAGGGSGQGSTTKEFGTGVLYSGGGGGGSARYSGASGKLASNATGGVGGGGAGGVIRSYSDATPPVKGSHGTGGGGGGAGSISQKTPIRSNGAAGGSGNVIITW